MNGLTLLLGATVVFLVGYAVYSKFLSRVLGIDPSRPTPAHTRQDGCDYVPAHPTVLFGHHFAAIAGAGPIVGPVLAAEFGWAAVTLWIVFGCVLIGAAHDMIALFLSVRHDGESIGSVIGTILGRPGKILFLLFSWSALVLVVAEFNRQIAGTFVADPAIATASLLFIGEAILFGLCVYRLKMPVLWASLIFVPLMFAFVWIGNVIPFDIVKLLGITPEMAGMVWIITLLVYCFFASTCPVWILLQPRDYLNAYLLYAMMALGFLGVFIAHPTLNIDAFAGFSAVGRSGGTDMLFPFLFVTVACGACSGFHALVASGTSAKQLSNERSIRPIAYGGMLLEGVLAMIALIGVAGTYLNQADYVAAVQTKEPVQMFASTIAGFCVKLFTGIGLGAETGKRIAESFMLLSVSAFLMTTVDAGTRLARFSWQELVAAFKGGEDDKTATSAALPEGQSSRDSRAGSPAYKVCHNMYVGTFVVVVLAAALLLGNPKAAKQLWTIFASANQLLASLTLLSATLWFIKNRKPCWMTAVPMVLMLGVSSWALSAILVKSCRGGTWTLAGASAFLIAVAVALICFAVNKFCRREK
ncbi:MAG: carbon starvation protein A [Kiritimatiellae bacterium]|nr:carbon starvation protein A [Kiritimatiellia bacterium]